MPRRNRTKSMIEWTHERIAELKILWADHASVIEIAEIMGLPVRPVMGKAASIGLRKKGPAKKIHVSDGKVKPPGYVPVVHVAYGTPKKLHELEGHECRWPIGDPKQPDFHFCSANTEVGKSYCKNHEKLSRSS